MADKPTCPECGGELPASAPDGLCLNCTATVTLAPKPDDLPPNRIRVGEQSGEDPSPVIGLFEPLIAGRYKLLKQLGEGGFGVVYLAEQEEPVRRQVALKVIKLGMDTKQVVARFEAERQALAMMDHPNIAKVLDGGATENGRPFFVMEFVDGIPITEYCDRKNLKTERRLELFMTVCQAIQHAHQKGIIHRDIKPSNAMVTLQDGQPVPKVIDFGIAKATEQKLTELTLVTQQGQVMGTPAYMSPEQAGRRTGGEADIDTRTDVYSLGVLLYVLLTGSPPFRPGDLLRAGYEEMLRKIREDEAPKPSTRLSTLDAPDLEQVARHRNAEPRGLSLRKRLQGDLDWIVLKALEKDRGRRYETASGLARDIAHHLRNEPIDAMAPSVTYRFGKFARRNKIALAAAGAVVCALILGTVVSMSEALRAQAALVTIQQEQTKTQKQKARAENALELVQMQRAEDRFVAGDSATALAYLGAVLRQNPSNRIAAERVISALSQRRFALPVGEPLKHDSVLFSVHFSPNGQQVVTASYDNTARVWDATTGLPLTEALRHEDGVWSARFSPDGLRVVTASFDNTARVWDVTTSLPLTEPIRHEAGVRSAEFSPDGLRVVTASHDNTARVWDATTGLPLTEPLRHANSVASAEFSPDGNRVVTVSADRTVRVWDATTGLPLTKPLRNQGEPGKEPDSSIGRSAHFSPDALRLVSSSFVETAQVWDIATGLALTELLGHEDSVVSADFSPDGLRVLTASFDNTARLWDANTGLTLSWPLRHDKAVFSAEFGPDGLRVVTASMDKTARIWSVTKGSTLANPLRHDDSVTVVRFSPDGSAVVTASMDKTARIWDATTGMALTEPLRHEDWVRSVEFSPDGSRLVTTSKDAAQLWDAITGLAVREPLRHEAAVRSAEFSPDALRVITASNDKTARIWNATTGLPLTEPLRHDGAVISGEFSPDGLRVVTVSDDRTAQAWDATTGLALTEPIRHSGSVYSAHFSPDGLRVVTASEDTAQLATSSKGSGMAQIWDAATGEAMAEPLRHDGAVLSAEFSPDGSMVVTASEDKTVRVWDAATGQALSEPLRHDGVVRYAAFSPDGLRVVTASEDKTARVWDAATGLALSEPFRHDSPVNVAVFSPDGLRVITASLDKTAWVWEIPIAMPPVPEWLAEMAETVGGRRLDIQRISQLVPATNGMQLKQSIQSSLASNYYTRWAQWFFADRTSRAISPFSVVTVSEYVRRRVEENTLASLQEAMDLVPTNGLALARLAFKSSQPEVAELLSQRAVKYRPDLLEAWQSLAVALERNGKQVDANEAFHRTVRLQLLTSLPVELVPPGFFWKYLDDDSEPDIRWSETEFDDGNWCSGLARFGYGEAATVTSTRSNRLDGIGLTTTYFRRSFDLLEVSPFTNLYVKLLHDDGGIVFLNGAEIFRSNMPTGTVTRSTLALHAVTEPTRFRAAKVDPSLLRIGANVIAVGIHQSSTNNSDLAFDLELLANTPPIPPDLIYVGSEWKFLDTGSSPGTNWMNVKFDDETWRSGAGEFGYGDGDETTLVRSNRLDGTRIITTYFRHAFNVPDPARCTNLTVNLLRDDGAIVYLNGKEISRSNMPSGRITPETLAERPANDFTPLYRLPADRRLLRSGKNVIAVEVHQSSATSSDLSFDLELIP